MPIVSGVQRKLDLGDATAMQKAIDAVWAAQPEWAATNPQKRARVFFKFKEPVEVSMDELVHTL